MKGCEFRNALEAAGLTQKDFAETMGVHRTVIGRQFAAAVVDQCWVYALAGLLATKMAKDLTMMVKT